MTMIFKRFARADRAKGVTAVLGPTNTGKTHLAIERMLAHGAGVIGLPLRLLAREVYGRVVEKAGIGSVALVTGEEKIKPEKPRYWVATIEAMPRDVDVPFVAIDEVQLAADLDRGHVFTDRLLHARGTQETLIIGSSVARPLVERLLSGVNVVTRPRLSKLSFAGEKKITRLPPRSAIVAFSAEEVYAIAELIRRQKGGAAVVLGALSPRTRNAQVELFQAGDVDFIVATDAIGMGLNLDVDHVAFSADRKFDGHRHRRLTPAEMGQVAGRAGRYMRDGSFGSSGRCPPFDADLVEALENHKFDPLEWFQWRNSDLDFSSLDALQASLAMMPQEPGLTRAPAADDVIALEIAARDKDVREKASSRIEIERLWQVCQLPDYRKVAAHAHSEMVMALFGFLAGGGRVPDDWLAGQIAMVDRTDGDIDTLSARIAQVRTWTFAANRPDWLIDPEHWQGETRRVEDSLSDALHEKLAQRFVDRRTSVLMRRLKENAMLEAEITASGDVLVEGHDAGRLQGFRFTLSPEASGPDAKALRAAALKALSPEFETRGARFADAKDDAIVLASDGAVRWRGEVVGKLVAGDSVLKPRIAMLADEHISAPAREKIDRRLSLWIAARVEKLLGPLLALENPTDLTGVARGIAFQASEALGVLDRARVAQEMKSLEQEGRAKLRALGLRFGAYHIYAPALLKPAPRALATQLYALKHGGPETVGLESIMQFASSGRTSFPADPEAPKALFRAAGFRLCGKRAVRVDILERLADLIRPAVQYRPGLTQGTPPAGTADGDGFVVTGQMTSLAGCAGDDFSAILTSLGYTATQRPGPAITVPLAAPPAAPPAPLPEPAQAASEQAPAEAALAPAAPSDDEPFLPGLLPDAEPAPAAIPALAAAEPEPAPAVATLEEQQPAPPAPPAEAAESVETTASAETVAAPVAVATEGQAVSEVIVAESAVAETVVAEPGVAETAVAETAVAETVAAEGAPAEVAEPELIEVWRQQRQAHPRQRQQGQSAGEARERQRPRRDRGPRPAEPAREASSPASTPQTTPAPDGAAQRDQRQGRDQSRGDGGRPQRRDKRHGQRPERRPDAPQRQVETAQRHSAPRPEKRPPKAIDPDNPFAKLMALKARMEEEGRR
ncbi:ATP-dependent RNA helicase SUPV3L1/SUV3 [Rhizobiales bacterium GAS113]|nr:ATP-dependent RNA helicase SUPV3L1/SUV3 [Rhizobiales bacterium GAS113]